MADQATKIYKDLNAVLDQTTKQLEKLADQSKKNADIQKILLDSAQKLSDEYSKAGNLKELTDLQKELEKNTKSLTVAQKNATAITDEELKAKLRLQEAEKVRKQTLRAEVQAENASVGSKKKLRAENKLLRQEAEDLNTETQEGARRLKEINAQLDANNKKIKDNSDAYSKQKIEIGNYKENITEALKEQEVFGLSINKITGLFSGATGVIGGAIAVLGGLTKAYISSARGTNDLARASDRLDSILNNLGNSIADAGGEGGFFDRVLAGLQIQFLGIASTVKSTVIVSIKETLRELEVLEVEQERQKKAQLDRAEVLRQIRDEERNSFAERKAANDELGGIINERESESVAFQEKRLKNLQVLLNQDKENLEIQKAIKEVEFEIADIREEAQGFRSEQLANDLALSREFNANEIELTKERVRAELLEVEKGSEDELRLKEKLAEETLKLELQAAGENQQLRDIAKQKFINDVKELEKAYIDSYKARLDAAKKFSDKLIEVVDKENDAYQKEIDKQEDEEIKSYLDKEIKKTEILKEQNKDRLDAENEFNRQLGDSAIAVGNALFDIKSEQLARESERIAEEFDARLASEELDQEQRDLIEAERTEKENQLAKKQRDLEKKQFLFNQGVQAAEVAIDTAQKVAAIKANIALLLSNPITAPFAAVASAQIPFVLGTGAAAIAAIAAQSIPAFDKGTKSAPGNGFVAGEKRDEFMIHNGQVSLVDRPTLFGSDYKGAEIISGVESARIIDQINRGQVVENIKHFNNEKDNQMFAMALDKVMGDKLDKHANKIIRGLKQSNKQVDSRYEASRNKFS